VWRARFVALAAASRDIPTKIQSLGAPSIGRPSIYICSIPDRDALNFFQSVASDDFSIRHLVGLYSNRQKNGIIFVIM
jgi:hypothetical protein